MPTHSLLLCTLQGHAYPLVGVARAARLVVSADSGGYFRAWCSQMFVCLQSFSSKAAVQGIGLHALLAPDETAPRLLATAAGTYTLEQFTAYATEAPQAQVSPPWPPRYEQTYHEDTH